MGTGYEFICPACKTETGILFGVGFAYPSLFQKYGNEKSYDVESLLTSSTARKVRELLDAGWELQIVDLQKEGWVPYYCPKCKTLEMRFDFTLAKDGETWSPGNYRCGTCRTKLEPACPTRKNVFGKVEYVRCEKCGELIELSKALENYGALKWD